MKTTLRLVLHFADVRAPDGVDEVPRREVEDEGVELEPHEDGEGEEGDAARQLHVVQLLPVARTSSLSQFKVCFDYFTLRNLAGRSQDLRMSLFGIVT